MATVKNISKILGCIVKKQVIFIYALPLKGCNIGIRVVMSIYVPIRQTCNDPDQKKADKYPLFNSCFFKKVETANKPAKKNEVKNE